MKKLDYIFLALLLFLIGLTLFFIFKLTTQGGQCALNPEKFVAESLQKANPGKQTGCTCMVYDKGIPYEIHFNSTNQWTRSNSITQNNFNFSLSK